MCRFHFILIEQEKTQTLKKLTFRREKISNLCQDTFMPVPTVMYLKHPMFSLELTSIAPVGN